MQEYLDAFGDGKNLNRKKIRAFKKALRENTLSEKEKLSYAKLFNVPSVYLGNEKIKISCQFMNLLCDMDAMKKDALEHWPTLTQK